MRWNPLSRLLARRTERRRINAMAKIKKLQRFAEPLGDLRQFLYLDDTALRSLYVARYGAEAVKITESESQSREAGIRSGASHSIPATVGLHVEGRWQTSASAEWGVERLVSKQSMFRDFLNAEIRVASGPAADVNGSAPLWRGIESEGIPARFKRGQLVEVQIRLQAHKLYRFASFFDSVGRLAGDSPHIAIGGTADMEAGARLLQELLIGQVPIDSELTGWGWNESTDTLSKLGPGVTPLTLVALTDVANYWTDLRRMLFDGLECTALVRLSDDAPVRDWSPLKLFNAIRGMEGLPGVDEIDKFIHDLDGYLTTPAVVSDSGSSAVAEALTDYAVAISGNAVSEIETDRIGIVAASVSSAHSTSAMNTAFSDVEAFFSPSAVAVWSGDELADLRDAARSRAGIRTDGSQVAPAELIKPRPDKSVLGRPQIAGDIIAIYW
jgi:hypothetical protein